MGDDREKALKNKEKLIYKKNFLHINNKLSEIEIKETISFCGIYL